MEVAHYHGDNKIPLSHRTNALRPQTTDFNNYEHFFGTNIHWSKCNFNKRTLEQMFL